MSRVHRLSAVVLWLAAVPLCWLGCYRPFTASAGRAAGLARQVAGWQVIAEEPLTSRHHALLGTDDVSWWRWHKDGLGTAFSVAVYHGHNWKSLHPPHICLEGSDMTLVEDGAVVLEIDGTPVSVGRIVGQANSPVGSLPAGVRYLSYYAYGSDDLVDGSYTRFVLHHLPRAVFRRATSGFLLRVETWADDSMAAAETRCRSLMAALVPAARERLR